MSINRDMRKYELLVREDTSSESGAKKSIWTQLKEVSVAIYDKSERFSTENIKYKEATHIGLTRDREILSGMELKSGAVKYQVMARNGNGRLVSLVLKVVTSNG